MNINFGRDFEQEKITIDFLEQTLFKYLEKQYNANIEIINDKKRQMQGIDMLLGYENIEGVSYVDVKAQMNKYIANPTPTFCLELSFVNGNGETKVGWFLKDDLKTDTYILIWIHDSDFKQVGEGRLLDDFTNIKELELMCVKKQTIKEYLNGKGLNDVKLQEIANYFKSIHGKYLTRRFFNLDTQQLQYDKPSNYISFTKSNNLPEKSVNIVVSKRIYEEICLAHYKIKKENSGYSLKILKEAGLKKDEIYQILS